MDEIVKLDVGGHLYTTTRSTLTRYPDSMLGAMFSGRMPSTRDPNGAHTIDGDGPIFRYVLSFLRRGKLNLPTDFKDWDMLKSEADFYQIQELQDAVTKTTENTSTDFIEIVLRDSECTYHGNHETLKQLPLLLEFLTIYTQERLNRPSRQDVLAKVERDGYYKHFNVRHHFYKQMVGIFQEILNYGFEMKTSSIALMKSDTEELRWTFTRKIH